MHSFTFLPKELYKCGCYPAKGGMQSSGLSLGHWELAHVQKVQTTGMDLSGVSTSDTADVTLMGPVIHLAYNILLGSK